MKLDIEVQKERYKHRDTALKRYTYRYRYIEHIEDTELDTELNLSERNPTVSQKCTSRIQRQRDTEIQ